MSLLVNDQLFLLRILVKTYDTKFQVYAVCMSVKQHDKVSHTSYASLLWIYILLGPISQRDLSPDLDLNLRLWSYILSKEC